MKATPFRSRRADGRGHVPKGHRFHRDNPIAGWPSVSDLARAVIAEATAYQLQSECARFCGTSRKTVWRWKVGHDLPGPRYAKRLALFAQRLGLWPDSAA